MSAEEQTTVTNNSQNTSTTSQTENSTSENSATNQPKSNSDVENQQPSFVAKIKNFFSSWKFKLILIFSLIITVLSIIFFWQHIIAMQSLKGWAKHAEAEAIDCMIQDTNDDRYISCTAKVDNQIVPLECGTSLLNMGCRVNYGNASPSVKSQEKTTGEG